MGLKEDKVSVASKFFVDWTETPIHWYGLEFDFSTLDEWIHVSYTPTLQNNQTISGDKNTTSVIDIDVLARKENRTFEIYDIITEMLSVDRIGNNSIKSVNIEGKDLLSTENGDYRVLKFSVYLKTF